MKIVLFQNGAFEPTIIDAITAKYPSTIESDLKSRSDPEIINLIENWNREHPSPRDRCGQIVEIPDELSDAWFIIRGTDEHFDGFCEYGKNKNPYPLDSLNNRYYEDIGFNLDKLNQIFGRYQRYRKIVDW